jgi:hypothetical protein
MAMTLTRALTLKVKLKMKVKFQNRTIKLLKPKDLNTAIQVPLAEQKKVTLQKHVLPFQ